MTTPGLPTPLRFLFKPSALKPGTRVGAYLIQETIGLGGGQMAYLAWSPDGRQVVLKMSLFPKGEMGSRRRKMHERFHRQITYLLQLNGVPGVATVLGHDMHPDSSSKGYLYMVQEWVRGGLNILDWSRSVPHPLDVIINGWTMLANACGEMDRRGICNRDLKPDNILMTPKGAPKIVDFNSGFSVGGAMLTTESATRVPGTPPYYSPELCQAILTQWDTGEVGPFQFRPPGDLHALGVIFYQVLTGEHPFDENAPDEELFHQIAYETPERPSALNPEVPFGLEKITMRLLRKDPEERYQSGDDLAMDLQALLRAHGDWSQPFQTPAKERHSTSTTSRSSTSRTSTGASPLTPRPRTSVGSAALDMAPSAIVLAGPQAIAVRGPRALLRLEPAPSALVPVPHAAKVASVEPGARPKALRRRVLLLAALFTLAPLLALTWHFQGKREVAGSYLEKGMMLLGKAKAAVVATASSVLAACVGLTGSARAGDKDWLANCSTPKTRDAAQELGLEPGVVGHSYLEDGPNTILHRKGGAEVRAGPVEVPTTISTYIKGIDGLLLGEIRTGSDGASLRFTRFKRDSDGREFPVCAIASGGFHGNSPGIPKANNPPPASELHPGFIFVTTHVLRIHFAQ